MHRKDPFEPGLCFIKCFEYRIYSYDFILCFPVPFWYPKSLWKIKVSQSIRDQYNNHLQITTLFILQSSSPTLRNTYNFNDIFFINRTQKWMGLGEWIRICLWKIRGSQVAHSYDNMHRMKSIMGLLHLAAGFLSPNVTKNGMLSHPYGTRTKTRTNNVKIFTTSSNFSHSLQGFSFTSAHQIPMLSTDGPILECSYNRVSWPYFSNFLSHVQISIITHSKFCITELRKSSGLNRQTDQPRSITCASYFVFS